MVLAGYKRGMVRQEYEKGEIFCNSGNRKEGSSKDIIETAIGPRRRNHLVCTVGKNLPVLVVGECIVQCHPGGDAESKKQ